MTSITIHNLSKSYGDTHAVQHLSLEVEKGELFGLTPSYYLMRAQQPSRAGISLRIITNTMSQAI